MVLLGFSPWSWVKVPHSAYNLLIDGRRDLLIHYFNNYNIIYFISVAL
jgi:hypothetical protein